PASLLQDFGGDRGAGNGRLTKRDVVAADHQYLTELHDLAGAALDFVDPDHFLGSHAVLFAAGSYDCEHGFALGSVRRSSRSTRFLPPATLRCYPRLGDAQPARFAPLPLGGELRLEPQVGRATRRAYGGRPPDARRNGALWGCVTAWESPPRPRP